MAVVQDAPAVFDRDATLDQRRGMLLRLVVGLAGVPRAAAQRDDGDVPPRRDAEVPARLVFSGSMDWHPNEDAVCYFADAILPRIRAEFPPPEARNRK